MKKKKLVIIGIILLAIGVIALAYYCHYYNSLKLNIINKSDYLINSFSIKCGEDKIELSTLHPRTEIVKRLYNFTGQELSFTLNCRNQIIGGSLSGVNARYLLGINIIIIENDLSVAEDNEHIQFVKVKSDLLYKK